MVRPRIPPNPRVSNLNLLSRLAPEVQIPPSTQQHAPNPAHFSGKAVALFRRYGKAIIQLTASLSGIRLVILNPRLNDSPEPPRLITPIVLFTVITPHPKPETLAPPPDWRVGVPMSLWVR